VPIYPIAAVSAMRSRWSPTAFTKDYDRDKRLSDPARPGDGTEDDQPGRDGPGLRQRVQRRGLRVGVVRDGEGRADGEIRRACSDGKLSHPSDPDATYDWVEFDEVSPQDLTSVDDIARSWYEGPGLDFAEWYFPTRLALDTGAAGTLVMKEGEWPLAEREHARRSTAPSWICPSSGRSPPWWAILAAMTSSARSSDVNPSARDARSPAKPRSDERRLQVLDIRDFTHIDPLSATDTGKAKDWYDTLAAWMKTNTPPAASW
jgi:hypothetical protein